MTDCPIGTYARIMTRARREAAEVWDAYQNARGEPAWRLLVRLWVLSLLMMVVLGVLVLA